MTPHPSWLIDLPTCPSTNTWALERLDALATGAVVWTEEQTAGRGRTGAWHSPPGVLTASFVVAAPAGGRLDDARLSLVAGLAVAYAVEDAAPGLAVAGGAWIKWPNDVLIGEAKLAGVLIERPASGDRAVVGIGLNLDPRWDADPEGLAAMSGRRMPVALAAFGASSEPGVMLALLRRYLLEGVAMAMSDRWPVLLAQVRLRDRLRGRRIGIEHGGRLHHGRSGGIDDLGRILLVDEGGATEAFVNGHVVLTEETLMKL